MVTNLSVYFVYLLLLPSKVHAYAINDLQYRRVKMAKMSETFCFFNIGMTFIFERNKSKNTGYQEKLHR